MSAADGPVFEVASVKPTNPQPNIPSKCIGGPGTASPGRLTCTSASLAMLVALAYDLQFYQIGGPDWTIQNAEGFDISATIPSGSSRGDFKLMLRNLLSERLHLVLRQESRQMDVYALRSQGRGAKLKEGPPQGPPIMVQLLDNGLLHVDGRGATMKALAGYLTTELRRPVNDETMLSGAYDFVLTFSPENVAANNPDAVQLRTALGDQLGLRLASTKGAVPMFIVEQALRQPTNN